MQTTDNVTTRYEGSPTGQAFSQAQGAQVSPQATYADYKVIRRNGSVVSFEPSKIAVAVTKAFLAVNGGQGAASARVRELVEQLTQNVVRALVRSRPNGGTFHIEDIQDQVELALMRGGDHDVARAYVLYREKRTQARGHDDQSRRQHAGSERHRQRRDASARHGCAARHHRIRLCEPGRRRERRPDHRGNGEEPVRRRADEPGLQLGHPRCAHADRKGPGVQPGHRAHPAAHDPPRDPRRGSDASAKWPTVTPSTSRSSSSAACKPSCSTTSCCSST